MKGNDTFVSLPTGYGLSNRLTVQCLSWFVTRTFELGTTEAAAGFHHLYRSSFTCMRDYYSLALLIIQFVCTLHHRTHLRRHVKLVHPLS